MYEDIRKKAIARMKKNRTFNVDFSDMKVNERPYIEVISINNGKVYMCAVKRVSYDKKTDKFYFISTNLLNGETIRTPEHNVLLETMCENVFQTIF